MDYNYIFFIIGLCVLGSPVTSLTNVNSCGETSAFIPAVDLTIENVECTNPPCTVYGGSNVNMIVNFTSPGYLDKIKPKIVAEALGVKLDYPTFQDDACSGITNTQCPLVKNEKITYVYAINVLDVFPEVSVSITFSIVDQNVDEDILCFQFDIQVKKK